MATKTYTLSDLAKKFGMSPYMTEQYLSRANVVPVEEHKIGNRTFRRYGKDGYDAVKWNRQRIDMAKRNKEAAAPVDESVTRPEVPITQPAAPASDNSVLRAFENIISSHVDAANAVVASKLNNVGAAFAALEQQVAKLQTTMDQILDQVTKPAIHINGSDLGKFDDAPGH